MNDLRKHWTIEMKRNETKWMSEWNEMNKVSVSIWINACNCNTTTTTTAAIILTIRIFSLWAYNGIRKPI